MSSKLNVRSLLSFAVVFVMLSGAGIALVPSFTSIPSVQKDTGSVSVREGAAAESDFASAFTPEKNAPALTDAMANPAEMGLVSGTPEASAVPGPNYQTMTQAEKMIWARSQSDEGQATPAKSGGMQTQGNLQVDMQLASLDAGGPYGGPTTFEGDAVTFTATQSGTPPLIIIRWDFNGDGKWDKTPTAVNCPTDCWSTDFVTTYTYLDNYYGNIVKAEAWDGVSFFTATFTGTILGDVLVGGMFFAAPQTTFNEGYRFVPTRNLIVTEVGAYRYELFPVHLPDMAGIWQVTGPTTGFLLQSCALSTAAGHNLWRYCSIPATTLVAGTTYLVSSRIITSFRFFVGENFINPNTYTVINNFGAGLTLPSRNIVNAGFVFPTLTSAFSCGGVDCIAAVDFKWTYSQTLPAYVSDTAFAEIHNVAPIVFDTSVAPGVGVEGTAIMLNSHFTDPGLKDSWTYTIFWGDGTSTGPVKISPFVGTADVLVLHSLGTDATSTAAFNLMKSTCGTFCSKFDLWDYGPGPGGLNTLPSLAKMMEYDVIINALNYFTSVAAQATLGDRLADFSDLTGGGVVMMMGSSTTLTNAAIMGRWNSQNYSPVPLSGFAGGVVAMGTVYDSDHLLMQDVPLSAATGFRETMATVRAGATRIVDLVNGNVMGSTKLNPVVGNGAVAVHVNFWPNNYFGLGGNAGTVQMLDNAIKVAARAKLQTMPIAFSAPHVYVDDHPSTLTSMDTFNVIVQVRDDDDGKVLGSSITYFTGFPTAGSFPAGWTEPAGGAWQSGPSAGGLGSNVARLWYFDCAPYTALNCRMLDQTLRSPSIDLSTVDLTADIVQVTYSSRHSWQANFPCALPWSGSICQEGWIEGSVNGFSTKVQLDHWWTFNPSTFNGMVSHDITSWAAGQSNVQIQYRMWQYDDWWWEFDDVQIYAVWGSLIHGLGEDTTTATIANVAPTATGGPTSGVVKEATPFGFKGYSFSDPALFVPTEQFAYRWDLDDGTVTPWTVVGSIDPANILLLETMCNPGPVGCAASADLETRVRAGVVAAGYAPPVIQHYSWFTPAPTPAAPSLAYLLQFDAILVTTNFAWIGGPNFAPFVTARALLGNRLADYLDITGRGVVGMFGPLDLSATLGTAFSIDGRAIVDKYFYGSQDVYLFSAGNLGQVYDPSHPLMQGVFNLNSPLIHNAEHTLTVSGGGGAAGHNGVLLADWSDGNTAIGVKQLDNGRTAIVPSYVGGGGLTGDINKAIGNALAWAAGGFESQRIPDVTHTYGDNGIYRADLQLLDDDMGFALNEATQTVTAVPGFTQTISHNVVPVEVENVDPVITNVRASFVGDLCLRLTGNSGNSLTMEVNDGTSTHSLTLVRDGNNPEVGCLTNLDIDVRFGAGASIRLIYDPADSDGANPSWIMEASGPGASPKIVKQDFNSKDGPQVREVSFGTILLGMPITFRVDAGDVGSDNLGTIWDWGDSTPEGIQVHRVDNNAALCGGANEGLVTDFGGVSIFTGCDDPIFERGLNSLRSPLVDPVSINDVQSHAFTQNYLYYVAVSVVDDDYNEGYPSTYLVDGLDMELILLDFR